MLIECIWLHQEKEAHRHVSKTETTSGLNGQRKPFSFPTFFSLSNWKVLRKLIWILLFCFVERRLEKPNPRCCHWGNEGAGKLTQHNFGVGQSYVRDNCCHWGRGNPQSFKNLIEIPPERKLMWNSVKQFHSFHWIHNLKWESPFFSSFHRGLVWVDSRFIAGRLDLSWVPFLATEGNKSHIPHSPRQTLFALITTRIWATVIASGMCH